MPTTLPAIKCCLLVDDHAGMRALLREILAPIAETFVECPDGAASLNAFRKARPDLVLMDLDMPVMDGLTATREILSKYPEARIIILTQHNSPLLKTAALAAGALAFLSKSNLDQLPEFLTELTK